MPLRCEICDYTQEHGSDYSYAAPSGEITVDEWFDSSGKFHLYCTVCRLEIEEQISEFNQEEEDELLEEPSDQETPLS